VGLSLTDHWTRKLRPASNAANDPAPVGDALILHDPALAVWLRDCNLPFALYTGQKVCTIHNGYTTGM
jgi:hypothetical protein